MTKGGKKKMAVLGAFGAVGVIFGVFLIIYGKIKKKKYRGGLITIISFVLFVVAIALSSSNEEANTNADETDTYKVSTGEITNEKLLISLAVRAETLIEKYDKIDNVTVKTENITAEKLNDMKDNETGEIYKNIYHVSGQYSWKEKRYDFELEISFDENDVESSGKIIMYASNMPGGDRIQANRSPVK